MVAKLKDGGKIASAREFEQYNSDEEIVLSDIFANVLTIDITNIQSSVFSFVNKGIGTEIASYKIFATAKRGVKMSTALPEVEDHWINLLSTGTYDHTTETTIPASVAATGTLTLVSAIAGDLVVVNGLTYTAVSGAKANDTEFSIDTSDTAAALDLADSIDDDVRTGITVPSLDVSATSSLGVVTVVCTTTGDLGNTIDISSIDSTITASGAFLTGGLFSKAFETLSNTWKYVIIMAKSATGTPTLKIWHRGEN